MQGKLLPENAEFERNFQTLLDIRKDLQAIEQGVKKWLQSARTLATHAKGLAKAVQTSQRDIDAYSVEMDTLLDDLVVLKSVTKKIGLLDELVRQRYHLRDLRQIKEGHERKLQQLEEQDRIQAKKGNAGSPTDFDVQINSVQSKIRSCTENYETELMELSTAVKFFVDEAGDDGAPKLLGPELSAFRSSQFQFFLLCQKLIAGLDTEVVDLESQWQAFAKRASTKVANARGLAKEKNDGEQHVKWNEDLATEICTSNEDDRFETDVPSSVVTAPMNAREHAAESEDVEMAPKD